MARPAVAFPNPSELQIHTRTCLFGKCQFSVSNESMTFKWLAGDNVTIMIFAPQQSFLMNAVH